MIGKVVTWLTSGLITLLNTILKLLPDWTPPDLAGYVTGTAGDYLGALNWFFPVSACVAITMAWAVAIIGYELYLWVSSFVQNLKALN